MDFSYISKKRKKTFKLCCHTFILTHRNARSQLIRLDKKSRSNRASCRIPLSEALTSTGQAHVVLRANSITNPQNSGDTCDIGPFKSLFGENSFLYLRDSIAPTLSITSSSLFPQFHFVPA